MQFECIFSLKLQSVHNYWWGVGSNFLNTQLLSNRICMKLFPCSYAPRSIERNAKLCSTSSSLGWVFLDVMHELAFGPSSPSSSLSSQGQTGSLQAPVPIGLLKEINLIQMTTISSREEYDVLDRSLFMVQRPVHHCFNGAWDCFESFCLSRLFLLGLCSCFHKNRLY